jgi:hypothetical protein
MRPRALPVLPLLLSLVGVTGAGAAIPDPTGPAAADVGRYHLQSNRWVNLHQRLMHEALFGTPPPDGLGPGESAAWKGAVDGYRAWVGRRSPIEDAELIRVNATLAASRKLPGGLPPPAQQALVAAAPIYERAQWPKDDAANRLWIAVAVPMLQSAAGELIAAHEEAYGVPFPKVILVDVTGLAWEFGGYTTGDGEAVHSTISSTDPAYQGFLALEMLMHEPSHGIVDMNSGAIGADLGRLSKALGRRPPYNLWHAILFYTSGELTRRALFERGVTDYKPFIDLGMFDRQFKGMQEPLETSWRAYLDHQMDRDEALKRILLATSRPPQP